MRVSLWGFAAALFLTATVPAAYADDAPAATPAPEKHSSCFSLRDWQGGWVADGDQTLYLKVRLHDIYRLDLAQKESFLNAPGMHLVSKSWGSDMVCNPIDLDLKIADNLSPHFPSQLFIKSITKLTPEEVKALPPKLQL